MAARASAKLAKYRSMRDFSRTVEPSGDATVAQPGRRFVIQQHAARRMHYDFRLELEGVLLSWSVPKGPSLSPRERRLAVRTEDHPLDYADFEGIIPQGEYGGGTVVVWDRGTWAPEGDARAAITQGKLTFTLQGEKLRGRWRGRPARRSRRAGRAAGRGRARPRRSRRRPTTSGTATRLPSRRWRSGAPPGSPRPGRPRRATTRRTAPTSARTCSRSSRSCRSASRRPTSTRCSIPSRGSPRAS
ncbi:MAG: hypothetical protein E6J90_40295 [Deltaproteobacteria bacterium]|nr:MAG: hypothetical protein E6J90_40295 [Deltaproteobacteria bacterium]